MSSRDLLSEQPYYDDYDANKDYTQIVAIPGRTEQAREFTQIQTIQRDFLSRLGSAIFANGTILSGCSLIITDKTATITAGTMFLDGLVRNIKPTSLTITGVGTEYIGARVRTELITENEDQSLRDPAQNYENSGQAGAHRVRESVEFLLMSATNSAGSVPVTGTSATTVFTLNNGEVLRIESVAADDSLLYETLARRTYDENGSYKVEGLELRNRNESDENGISISVSQGKAYVKGFEVTKQATTTLTLEYARDTRSVLSEPLRFIDNVVEYVLNYSPAKQINRVSGLLEYTQSVEHSNISGFADPLHKSAIDTIIKVSAGETEYVSGEDFQFTNGMIDWSLDGNEPKGGSTYKVTYWYWYDMIIDEDVTLIGSFNPDTNTYESKIRFLKADTFPISSASYSNAATVRIDYDFYLARKDLIVMDQQGAYTIYKGTSNVTRLVESPINQDDTKLVIGTALIRAGYSSSGVDDYLKSIVLSTYNSTRLSQANLYALKRRVDDLEYNTAMSDLDNEAMEGESPTLLRGIFTDGFIGLTKTDTTHDDFSCCIDLDNEELTLPISTNIVKIIPNESINETIISKLGNSYMAPYEDIIAISQMHATGSQLINPYGAYNSLGINTLGVIKLNPSIDNWVDPTRITINGINTVSTTLRRWWYHRGESWSEVEYQKWLHITSPRIKKSMFEDTNNATESISSTSSTVLDNMLMYMRQIQITLTAENFTPNANNIQCLFNDIIVPLTPIGTTRSGTNIGTVMADEYGKVTATFIVPKNVPCGTVNVVLRNATNVASTIYMAQGRNQIIQDTVLPSRQVPNLFVPIAQTFQFDKDTILTKLGLYFADKDTSRNLVLQIRNVQNDYPGSIVYDEVVIKSSEVSVSNNGTSETTIEFSQPIYCRADTLYCICLLTDSTEYELWTATTGQKNVANKSYVTSQPYASGTLFSSADAKSWTNHKMSDIKFKLYSAKFTTSKGVLLFNDVTTELTNRILIAAQSIDYQNNGINWYYRLKPTDAWLPIEPYADQVLNELVQQVQVKVELDSTASISPILSGNTINLISFAEQTPGSYISRTISLDNEFNTIVVSIEAYTPSGTNFGIQYLSQSNWIDMAANDRPVLLSVDNGETWYRHTYRVDLDTPIKSYKLRINLRTIIPSLRPRLRKLINILRSE